MLSYIAARQFPLSILLCDPLVIYHRKEADVSSRGAWFIYESLDHTWESQDHGAQSQSSVCNDWVLASKARY